MFTPLRLDPELPGRLFPQIPKHRETGEWSDNPELSDQTGSFTIPDLIDNMLIDDLGKHRKTSLILEREKEEEQT